MAPGQNLFCYRPIMPAAKHPLRPLADTLYAAALVAWVGSLWKLGYLVAPLLFATLSDRTLAGNLAGRLFEVGGWLGLGCGGLLVVLNLIRDGAVSVRRLEFWLFFLMGLMTTANLFGIQPLMAAMKADAWPRDVMQSVMRERFAAWHGISSILYLAQSLLGVAVVVRQVRR